MSNGNALSASRILSWIPGWLGFLLLILVGIAMVLNAIINDGLDHVSWLGFLVFGLCAIIIGAFSWIVGATSTIEGRVGKVGVLVGVHDLPWWGWVVDLAVLVISIALFFILK